MRALRWWVAALALGVLAPKAAAAPDPKTTKPAKADEPKPAAAGSAAPADSKPATPSAPAPSAEPATPSEPVIIKQDLSGHDLGPTKSANVFERDRFFVDKTDSEQTAKGTLVQGSVTSSTFGYHESGGTLASANPAVTVPSASPYDRLFTDLRLQTDFRHISAGRWDARIDVRGRLVGESSPVTPGWVPVTETHAQSGLFGKNELEIKELWLVRKGARSDVYIGRQFIPDLGALRIDGLRVDYATSESLTWLGFAGLYPIRGSRSITDDYTPLLAEPNAMGLRGTAGRFTGTGGLGAAYRTLNTYGSVGAVVVAPFAGETPRVYATSTGYWRLGSKVDFYHFLILDAVGSNAVNTGLTNLSLGLNWKPDQRLRGTLTFNRVDTETLSVQAQAFLQNPDVNPDYAMLGYVQNEAFIQRIATNQGRASLSAGLGELQRFELTAALSYRYRGDVTLSTAGATPVTTVIPASQSLEVYGSIIDRRSVGNLRLGLDASQIFGVGDHAFQRTTSTSVRLTAGHEIGNGRGEWDLEVAYNHNEDDGAGGDACTDLRSCYGAAKTDVVSGGGNLFIRISRNWLTMASLFVNRTVVTHVDAPAPGMSPVADPAAVGLSGFFRLAYRF
ncbi:MAG: hypothetical protein ABIY55_02810 [Kofleriaceae bacterium]